jgi:hypothetical protein
MNQCTDAFEEELRAYKLYLAALMTGYPETTNIETLLRAAGTDDRNDIMKRICIITGMRLGQGLTKEEYEYTIILAGVRGELPSDEFLHKNGILRD